MDRIERTGMGESHQESTPSLAVSLGVGALAGFAAGAAVGLAIVLVVIASRGTPIGFYVFFPTAGAAIGASHGLARRPSLQAQANVVLGAGLVAVFLAAMAVIGVKSGVL